MQLGIYTYCVAVILYFVGEYGNFPALTRISVPLAFGGWLISFFSALIGAILG